nr:hypothetical protein [Tanacetum cinerariifolium]
MLTKIELTLEQSQQGVSNDVLVSIKGVEELKRNVWIKGENKESLPTLKAETGSIHMLSVFTKVNSVKMEILLEPTSNKLLVGPVWGCDRLVSRAKAIENKVWNTVTIKQSNEFTRLQALVDKKKVVVTEAAIRDALHLDDAEGVDCLPNEEIFTELARMGYEKPSTKLTFYKAFFSSQWKFFIHTILQSMSAKCTLWNEFSSTMASAVICLSTGDLSTHTTKYISLTLTQKVFANMRRVGKGCSGVKTLLFEGMLVVREPEEQGDAEEQGNDNNAAEEPDTAVLEDDVEVAQNLEITKLKTRVKKLERANKVKTLKLRRLRKVGTSQRVDNSDDTLMEDVSNQGRIIDELDKDEDEEKELLLGIQRRNHLQKLLLKPSPRTKEKDQIEEEENRAIASINETPAQKAAKRRMLNEEAKDIEELKQHLEIVPDKDDDVYKEATPLARKVRVVDYQIVHINNKPHFKIIRADETHQLYVSFITLLKNFDREDLESLWNIVKERFSTSKPNNFSDDFLLTTLRTMFERPDRQDQVWISQRTVHSQARVKS